MRRVCRVAEQNDVATRPWLRANGRELPPDASIGDEAMTVELVGEQRFEEGRGLFFGRAVHAGGFPRRLAAFDNERRSAWRVLIRVNAPESVIVALEVKGKGGKRLRRPEPDEPVRPQIDRGLDPILEQLTDGAVGAVGGDDEVGVVILLETANFALEQHFDAGGARLLLQHAQQRVAAHAAEAVSGRGDPVAAIVHLDVVPVHEVAADAAKRLGIGFGDAGHRRVGEDHTKTEGVVGTVALDDSDVVARIRLLHQAGEVKAARSAADADDVHHWNFGGRFATKASYASRKSACVISNAWVRASASSAVARS